MLAIETVTEDSALSALAPEWWALWHRSSSATPFHVEPESVTTCGLLGSRAAIARTSVSLTAHTSHSACVTIRSGASEAMASSSSR